MATGFISGHLSLTAEEFDAHYRLLLEAAAARGDSFVVGDAAGADLLAQEFLHQAQIDHSRVTVYHMFEAPRHNAGNFPTSGGYQSNNAKDKAMTAASDYDIAWVRPGREDSGTARNIERRRKKQK